MSTNLYWEPESKTRKTLGITIKHAIKKYLQTERITRVSLTTRDRYLVGFIEGYAKALGTGQAREELEEFEGILEREGTIIVEEAE